MAKDWQISGSRGGGTAMRHRRLGLAERHTWRAPRESSLRLTPKPGNMNIDLNTIILNICVCFIEHLRLHLASRCERAGSAGKGGTDGSGSSGLYHVGSSGACYRR